MKQLKAVALDTLPIALILAVDLLFFHRAILYGEVFFERDTRVFYYPTIAAIGDDLRNWILPLWSPNIFGGFPLFADGEAGMLYPPVAALVYFLPPQQALIWITVSHIFMAGLFTYAFLRALTLGRFGSTVGAISFMLGGFTIAQIHHINLSNSAVWLPLVLCFVERSIRTVGARRYVSLLLAGGALGMQSLAVHVNVLLMSLPVIIGYIAFRIVLGPVASRRKDSTTDDLASQELEKRYEVLRAFGRRIILACKVVLGRMTYLLVALFLVPLTGLAIASVQLLPLYELGTFSRRAGGLDYVTASSQAQTVFNLVTLIFPYFFRDPSNVNWGLWSPWETRVYVGILPLLLSVTAIVLVRSRVVLFFAAVGATALLVGLAETAPFNLHAIISSLPGYNLIRAPGRYSYLWTFSAAILAAYAADWLANPIMGRSSFRFLRERWRPESLLWRLPALAFFVLLTVAVVELYLVMQQAAEFVLSHKQDLLSLIQQQYLSLPGMARPPEYVLSPTRVYDALSYAFGFSNPSIQYGLILAAASVATLVVGYSLRRAKWLWQIAVVALVAGDLTLIGWQFHPTIQVDQLASPPPAADFLKEQQGLYRVFSALGTSAEPNILLPSGIAEASGYSSLQFERQAQYAAATEFADDQLMDIFNIRYIISRNRYVPQPSFELVTFNPGRPLMVGKSGNPASRLSFSFPDQRIDRVRVLSHLQFASHVPQGTPVGEVVLFDATGKRYVTNLLAGVHTAEWGYDRPDVRPNVKHLKPAQVAFTWANPSGPRYLYYADIRLEKPVVARRVELASTTPNTDLRVYGLTVLEESTARSIQATRNNNDRFRIAYRDSDVLIRENTRFLPRTYLVPEVRVITESQRMLHTMAVEPLDATKTVIVEENDEEIVEFQKKRQSQPVTGPIGSATMKSYQPQSVQITANANDDAFLFLSDTFYPGWRAMVDGNETKIYRANYLFRAIRVPKGTHDIQFVFTPSSFQQGLLISVSATLVVLAAWLGLQLASLYRLARRRWPSIRPLGAKTRAIIKGGVRVFYRSKKPTVH